MRIRSRWGTCLVGATAATLFFTGWMGTPAHAANAIVAQAEQTQTEKDREAALKRHILREANVALRALKDRDFDKLADMAAPAGIRFTPYAYVMPDGDLTLTPQQIREAWTNRKPYIWGLYDGTGLTMRLDFRSYYARFLNNLPYTAPDGVGYNREIGSGNTYSNLYEVYPYGKFVEFYVKGGRSGVEDVGGMDWGSLRFVFEEFDGQWKLVGIVNDQWTT